MRTRQRTTITLVIFTVFFTSGRCQFPGLSGMSNMYGSMNPSMMSGMSGMFGSLNPLMMSNMDGMMNPMMMMMGSSQMNNDPLMRLAMATIEFSGSELMVLNNLVHTIVGPGATVNPGLMVLYSNDGGLPINAAKMIPYITIMQGIAKDLKIKVPGVVGEASKEQIENHIFQKSLQWMQQRNMAGAFNENAGLFLMSNAMNNGDPFSSSSMTSSSSQSASANSAAATAQAAAASQASLAQYIASQSNKQAAADPAAKPKVAASATAAAAPKSTPSQHDIIARLMAAVNSQAASGMSGYNTPMNSVNSQAASDMSGYNMPMNSGQQSGNRAMNSMNLMAMGGMEMMGF